MRISGCIITKDEENNITRCINSLKPVVSEIIVVDTGSSDNTVDIAKKLGAKVYHFEWVNDFSKAKNYAISKATGNWIIFLDADEYLDKDSVPHVSACINEAIRYRAEGIYISLVNYDTQQQHIQSSVAKIQIFKKDRNIRYFGAIHEMLKHEKRNIVIHDCSNLISIIHTGYSKDEVIRKNKGQRNIDLLIGELKKNNDNFDTFFYLAESYAINGDMELGLYYALRASNENKSRILGAKEKNYLNIIKYMMGLKYPESMIEKVCTDAIKLYPNYPDYYIILGNIYAKSNKNEDAIIMYEKALSVLEGNSVKGETQGASLLLLIYKNLSELYYDKNDFNKAVHVLTLILKTDKYEFRYLNLLMKILLNNGELEENITDFLNRLYDLTVEKDLLLLLKASINNGSAAMASGYMNLLNKANIQLKIEETEILLLQGDYEKVVYDFLFYYNEDKVNRQLLIKALTAAILSRNNSILDNVNKVLEQSLGFKLRDINNDTENENYNSEELELIVDIIKELKRLSKYDEIEQIVIKTNQNKILLATSEIFYHEKLFNLALSYYDAYIQNNQEIEDKQLYVILYKMSNCLYQLGEYNLAKSYIENAYNTNNENVYKLFVLWMAIEKVSDDMLKYNEVKMQAMETFPSSIFFNNTDCNDNINKNSSTVNKLLYAPEFLDKIYEYSLLLYKNNKLLEAEQLLLFLENIEQYSVQSCYILSIIYKDLNEDTKSLNYKGKVCMLKPEYIGMLNSQTFKKKELLSTININGQHRIQNILYLGWVGKGNVGDELLLDLFKHMFNTYHNSLHNYKVNIDAIQLTNDYIIDISKYDLVVLGGGSLIHSHYYLTICIEAFKYKIPVVSWGTGVDGYYNNNNISKLRLSNSGLDMDFPSIFNQFSYLSVRGPLTKTLLNNIGISKEIDVIGDPALAYELEICNDSYLINKNNSKQILINWGTSNNNIFGNNEAAVEERLIEIIHSLISQGYEITIYPIWTEDIKPVKSLWEKVNKEQCKVITKVYDAKKLIDFIKKSQLTINLKLHANILSAAAGIPFISLAYRGKCFDFAESVDLTEYCMATDQLDCNKILELATRINNNYNSIVNHINNKIETYYPKIVNSILKISKILNDYTNNKVYKEGDMLNISKDYFLSEQNEFHEIINYIFDNVNETLKSDKTEYNYKDIELIIEEAKIKFREKYSDLLTQLNLTLKFFFNGLLNKDALIFYLSRQFDINNIQRESLLEAITRSKELIDKKVSLDENREYSKVSVIITTYNRKEYLKQCINSVLDQDYPNIEIIIIDDCSSDGTNEMILKNYSNLQSIIYMRNGVNKGPGNNRRIAFNGYADGEYILFIDDDDYLINRNYITQSVDYHLKHPNASFVAANVFVEYTNNNILKPSILKLDKVIKKEDYFINFGMKGYEKPFSTLTAVFKRNSLVEANIMNMRMVNDTSIYLSSLLVGDGGFINEIVGVYRLHGNNITFSLNHDFIIENLEEKIRIKEMAVSKYGYNKVKMDEWMDVNAYSTINYYLNNAAKTEDDFKSMYLWTQMNCPNILNRLNFKYV